MRSRRALTFFGMAVCVTAGAAWSCSPFDGAAAPEGADGGTIDSLAPDTSAPDGAAPDTSVPRLDAGVASPCPGGAGAVVFTSSFGNAGSPSLAGWTPQTTADALITAELTDAGANVARGTIMKGASGQNYAVISHEQLPLHAAVRFSFSASELRNLYVYHQTLDVLTPGANLSLSLQSDGWRLGTSEHYSALGPPGAAGAWHTLTYRVDGAPNGGAIVYATLDKNIEVTIDVSTTGATYDVLQLGPFWPIQSQPAPIAVDYADVTVWDCSK